MFYQLIKKEFILARRSLAGLVSLFSLLIAFVFLFHYAMEKNSPMDLDAILGVKWTSVFILTFILVSQSVFEEREDGALDAIKPIVPAYLNHLTKCTGLFIVLISVECIYVLLLIIFFPSAEKSSFLSQILFLFPASFSIISLGVFLSIFSSETRFKEILLPVLLIPLSLPVFSFGIEAERRYSESGRFWEGFLLLSFFALFYFSLGALFLESGITEEYK